MIQHYRTDCDDGVDMEHHQGYAAAWPSLMPVLLDDAGKQPAGSMNAAARGGKRKAAGSAGTADQPAPPSRPELLAGADSAAEARQLVLALVQSQSGAGHAALIAALDAAHAHSQEVRHLLPRPLTCRPDMR